MTDHDGRPSTPAGLALFWDCCPAIVDCSAFTGRSPVRRPFRAATAGRLVMLGKVKAVADDELVGALEADIAARDVGLGRRVLAHERRHRKRRRPRDCRLPRRQLRSAGTLNR